MTPEGVELGGCLMTASRGGIRRVENDHKKGGIRRVKNDC